MNSGNIIAQKFLPDASIFRLIFFMIRLIHNYLEGIRMKRIYYYHQIYRLRSLDSHNQNFSLPDDYVILPTSLTALKSGPLIAR